MKIKGKQIDLISGTDIKTINGSSIIGSGDLSLGVGGLTLITGDLLFDFDNETDFVSVTVTNVLITNTNIKSVSFLPLETNATSLDDFKLNAVTFNVENIINNISFDVVANSVNNASGNYSVKYLITI
jgi:hypothetical protein